MRFVGSNEELAFFEKNGQYAAIYLDTNLVANLTEYDLAKKLEELPERPSTKVFSDSTLELANSALTFLDPVVAAGDRMYTIPDGVISEAKKALEWRKEHKRGGTPVGLNTARTLAKGGQIGIRKVRHIAKYFPRHEVDKKGKGWDAGEDGYPSNGKIAWALWGGDAAWRWSRAIVEREDSKARTAGGYALPGYEDDLGTYGYDGYDSDLSPFKLAHDLDSSVGPEFMARVRMDGSGVDRLYKIEIDGTVAIWDDCGWDNLGHVDGDVYFYDKALDDEYDSTPCEHVLIDPSSAVVISAFMQERPFQPVRLEEIDPEEAGLVAEGLQDEDFGMIDRVMSIAQEPIKAAGQVDAPSKSKADKDGDGVLDSDFLSKKAESQPRDASGLFVKVGSRVVVGGDRERGSGVLDSIDYENNKVNVKLDSGKTIAVSSKYTEGEDRAKEKAGPMQVPTNMPPLDLSGIIGKPRTAINQPLARVPGTMRPLTDKAVGEMLTDWSAAVKKDRESYIPLDAADKAKARAAREALLKARASNDTYQKRVAEAQKRVDENNRKRGNN